MSTSHLTKLKRKAAEFEQKKQFDKALSLYVQFVDEAGRDLDDADLQLFNRVGDLLTRQGNPSEALTYYEKAVDMYAERGFLNNAIALCNKILRQSPARTAVYYKLGKISASKGFRSDARKNFLEYADRMQKAGQREEALRALKEFADLCPDQDDIRLMLAEMLSRDSRSAEAIEQLEQLYARQEAEGRVAEARATADRIKAIDPEATPRGTGAFQAVKGNDLVFIDLGESTFTAARRPSPGHLTPVPPPPVVETVDVSGVAALAGLSITFLPDESEAPPAPSLARLTPLPGLETVSGPAPDAEPTPALDGLDLPVAPVDAPAIEEGLDVEVTAFESSDEIVPQVDGLASAVVTLTGSHPSLAPLIEDPPMSGAEFGSLSLATNEEEQPLLEHDLGLASSLPRLDELSGPEQGEIPPLLDETPDAWVQAALGAPRSDVNLEHLLTPLGIDAIVGVESAAQFEVIVPAAEAVDPAAGLLDAALSELAPGEDPFDALDPAAFAAAADTPVPTLPELSVIEPGIEVTGESTAAADALNPEFEVPSAFVDALPFDATAGRELSTSAEREAVSEDADDEALPSFAEALVLDEVIPAEPAVTGEARDEVEAVVAASSVEENEEVAAAASGEGVEAIAPADPVDIRELDLELSGAETPELVEAVAPAAAEASIEDAVLVEALDPIAAAGPDEEDADETTISSIISEELAAVAEASEDAGPSAGGILDTAALRAAMDQATANEAAREDAMLRAAFEDERVELPLIDLERDAATEEVPTFDTNSGEIDALLSAPPSFDEDASPFEPEPLPLDLDEASPPSPSTEEWVRPEVLIDGEWRNEHVGDLVSGEMFVIGERREVSPPHPGPIFDDLSAAMLYEPGEADDRSRLTPRVNDVISARPTPRHTLSFGGTEAQLRRRLELNPSDVGLRRQLAEALLDLGDREGGLNELEAVVSHFEAQGKLEDAGGVVDVILRVVPLSVRHHQKRVEYAARSGNRAKLVEAYTELGDALFRCGEPDKARVVYTRVVELAPTNERVRFALGMLSADPGTPRQSDEIPAIESGVLGGNPSLTIANLTPESVEAEPGPSPEPEPLLDEVDAAFASPTISEQRRRTSELMAVEEWASKAEPPAPQEPPQGDFVDLGDWLRGEGSPRSTRMVASDVAPSGDEAADFAEMLRRFKSGVDQNVDAEDFDSHYDLGVAFKEMGLVDEAIAQFQRSLRGEAHRVRSYEALGQCFVEKGQFDVAIALLQRAAEQPGADVFALCGVLYLLGYSCEQVGRRADAMRYFQRVFAVDIAFRDVAARLAALERSPQ